MLNEPIPSAGPPALLANIRYIQNGDALNTGNHQVQAQDVAQCIGHLEETKADLAGDTFTGAVVIPDLTLSGTAKVKVASRSITRHQSMSGGTASANWSQNATTLHWNNTAQGGTATILLDKLPHGNVLSSVTVRWKGAVGHGALPSPMPTVEVQRYWEDGTLQTLGSITSDTSADVTAYQALHDIIVSGVAHTIDLTSGRYYVILTGEGASDFVANAKATHVKVTCTVTSYSEY